jgi:hypothetical protein
MAVGVDHTCAMAGLLWCRLRQGGNHGRSCVDRNSRRAMLTSGGQRSRQSSAGVSTSASTGRILHGGGAGVDVDRGDLGRSARVGRRGVVVGCRLTRGNIGIDQPRRGDMQFLWLTPEYGRPSMRVEGLYGIRHGAEVPTELAGLGRGEGSGVSP